jgi:hypothetical protein
MQNNLISNLPTAIAGQTQHNELQFYTVLKTVLKIS